MDNEANVEACSVLFGELEVVCSKCKGKKGHHCSQEDSGWRTCHWCNGSGFIPAALGERVLALVRHNSRVKISAELEVCSDWK